MKLALVTLLLAYVVDHASGMSTCRTLDLEIAKKKRIEAIRSQILSKLRLPKEPESDQAEEKEAIPTALLSLYNSTKEMLNEQQVKQQDVSTEQEEEEYFAKVLNKFNMTNESSAVDMQTTRNISVFFNISEIRKSVGDYRLLTSAELRMLIKKPRLSSVQRVELYHVLGSSASYIASRFVDRDWKNKWMSFDVTATLKDWLRGNEDKKGFELRLFCECGDSSSQQTFGFDISGIRQGRGDTGTLEELSKQPPYILTMSIPANGSSHITSRTKRSVDARDTCTAQTESCCVRSLYIDFRKDLGWKWINKPTGYHANYCMGSCTYIWNAENKYSQILALYKYHNPGASAQPCCVPQTLEPLPILYYMGRHPKVEQLSDMIVKSCKCS